jgi:endogenous inhibitor of DNA gyrase (YacG/DUF329 family)
MRQRASKAPFASDAEADKMSVAMPDPTAKRSNGQHHPPCPICKTPTDPAGAHAPFCSKRCKQIDLGKWLGGDYTISRPVEERDLDEG